MCHVAVELIHHAVEGVAELSGDAGLFQPFAVTTLPSTSKRQHRFMEEAAHNPAFARAHGIKPGVAAEFAHADKGRVKSLPERAPVRKRPTITRRKK